MVPQLAKGWSHAPGQTHVQTVPCRWPATAWNPQIESVLYDEALSATTEGAPRPLAEQVGQATRAYPDYDVVQITPAAAPDETTGVLLQPPGAHAAGFGPAAGAFTVYVDPASATITGRIMESKRPGEWLRNLHSSFRLGTAAGTVTELAASLALVSLATGLYLWWPKTRSTLRRSLVPRLRPLRGGGRRPWRDLHASLGVLTLGALAVMLVTGLTWTEYAGRWVDVTKDTLTTEPPVLRTSLSAGDGTPAGDSHGAHSGGNSSGPIGSLVPVDRVVSVAEGAGINSPFVVIPPGGPDEAWSVAEIDTRWPIDQQQVAIDPEDRRVVDRLRFDENPLLEQATTFGIGFHEGTLFGVGNQIGLTVLALALIAIVMSGYVMWWRRRPNGAFGAPPRAGRLLRTVPLPLLVGFGLTLLLLPTLGVAFVLYLAIERVVRGEDLSISTTSRRTHSS